MTIDSPDVDSPDVDSPGVDSPDVDSPDVLAGYSRTQDLRSRRDEMLDSTHEVRPSWRGVGQALAELGTHGLSERRAAIERFLEDDGVTYRAYGSKSDQAWTLDPLPLLIDELEWTRLETAIMQRAELLDAILTDVYGERRLITDGLIPPAVIFGHAGFLRDADQIRVPGPRQLLLSSTDLARDSNGQWRVLSDRAQAPSGAGYAMENRSVLSRAMPGLYRGTGVHRIAPFFHTLRQSLQRVAPPREDSAGPPRVVLLSPGAGSETAFDQAFMSSLMGLPLTTGADLTVRDGRVWQRSLGRLEPVDVILRRVDDGFCDPLDLRGDSQLGVPGLLEAARSGSVSIVNGLGTGVLENPALFPYLPAICQAVRAEPLQLESAQTWWCGEENSRRYVLEHMPHLVIKPASRQVGRSVRLGWELSERQRATLSARIAAEPHAWVGQEPVTMSTAPTLQPRGLEPRPVVLRTFAVAVGERYELMPGGLTRAPMKADSIVVSNAIGAVSKDVWVLSAEVQHGDEGTVAGLVGPETVSAAVSPRVAEDLYWLGRYSERTESTARLLRVTDNRWRDLHPAPDPALARCLVTLLEAVTSLTTTWPGFVGKGAGARLAAPETELLSLVTDDGRVGTLAHDLGRVRSLANSVRDQLSSDTWMVLSGLDRSLTAFKNPGPGLDGARTPEELSAGLAGVLQATLAFSGLVAESMVRDTGWYFLNTGRRLERSLQITGLLRECLVTAREPAAHGLIVESVLIAAESIITHRRRYPARAGVDTVLELLLLDHGNPRSLAFQLDEIEHDLAMTFTDTDAMGPARELTAELRARLAGADLSALARPVDGRRGDLADLLDGLREQLRALHRLIEAAHFTQLGPLQPLSAFATAWDSGDPASSLTAGSDVSADVSADEREPV